MTLGKWLNSLSTLDHILLLSLYVGCVFLSKITFKSMIDYYNEKKQYNKFRIKFRISPFALLSLAFIYSFFLYQIFDNILDIMP